MKFIEKLKQQQRAKEALFSYHLHSLLSHKRPARSIRNVHASDVTHDDFCARRYALLDVTDTKPAATPVGTCQKTVWRQGEMLATAVIQWARQLGLAVGDWECAHCQQTWRHMKHPEKCWKCGDKSFNYREVFARSEISGIGGSMDLLLDLPGVPKHRIVEIKTIDKEKFKTLKMPLAEHRARSQLYLRLMAESNYCYKQFVDLDHAIVFYYSKGGYGERSNKPKEWGIQDMPWTPFKEFLISRDDEAVEEYVKAGQQVHDFRENNGPMPVRVCGSPSFPLAQKCEVRAACFSGKFLPLE